VKHEELLKAAQELVDYATRGAPTWELWADKFYRLKAAVKAANVDPKSNPVLTQALNLKPNE
jgi:hypothetical protein